MRHRAIEGLTVVVLVGCAACASSPGAVWGRMGELPAQSGVRIQSSVRAELRRTSWCWRPRRRRAVRFCFSRDRR